MRNIIFILHLFAFECLYSQRSDQTAFTIGFWNVENLYDTINDPKKNDDDFTPTGINLWNTQKYYTKIDRLAEVISQMAVEICPDGLVLMGLCEVENNDVLHDLVGSARLKNQHYEYVLIEGPDARGIDPAFIYNPDYFKVLKTLSYKIRTVVDSTYKTRDVLLVSGQFLNEPVTVLVNHWPSRRGGELLSRPNRMSAAKQVRAIIDSIHKSDANIKLIIMGDFNDDPIDESVKKIMGTSSDSDKTKSNILYNPMEKPYKKGIGTLAWQDTWNLFDQILLSSKWTGIETAGLKYKDVRIYNKTFLKADYGNFKGYPYRTFSGGSYTGGYSDHFPVYVIFSMERK